MSEPIAVYEVSVFRLRSFVSTFHQHPVRAIPVEVNKFPNALAHTYLFMNNACNVNEVHLPINIYIMVYLFLR